MKAKISAYLSDSVAQRLDMAAKRRGGNKSAIVDVALDRFLNPERDQSGDAALVRRLDRVSRQLDRLERDLTITAETVALYIRYYLTITPPLPGGDQEAARALGRERFELFVSQIGKRVAGGGRLIADVLGRVSVSNPDLLAQRLGEGSQSKNTENAETRPHDAAGRAPEPSPAGREGVDHV